MTSWEFPYFAVPSKVYNKSEAGVRLGSEAEDRNPDRRGAELH